MRLWSVSPGTFLVGSRVNVDFDACVSPVRTSAVKVILWCQAEFRCGVWSKDNPIVHLAVFDTRIRTDTLCPDVSVRGGIGVYAKACTLERVAVAVGTVQLINGGAVVSFGFDLGKATGRGEGEEKGGEEDVTCVAHNLTVRRRSLRVKGKGDYFEG